MKSCLKKFGPPFILFVFGLFFWWLKFDTPSPQKADKSIPSQILTTWTTRNTKLTLYQASPGEEVEGFFFNPSSNRIYGILKGRYINKVLDGEWIQAKSQKKCTYQKFGTFYWGRFNFVFDKDSFAGKWGYCNDALIDQWGGAERHRLREQWQSMHLPSPNRRPGFITLLHV